MTVPRRPSQTSTPPFEPGNGDDVTLDHPNFAWWPNSWALPIPNNCFHPIESEAVNAADAAVAEDQYAIYDWGDPGKQHRGNAWDD